MRVSLFITCFNDTLFPQTGRAVVRLLERLGCEVDFPLEQTCCGQMHRPHPGALTRQRTADLHQAGVVGGADDLGAGVEHPAHLVGQHRGRDLRVLHREGAAEAAALRRRRQVDELDPPHCSQ